jgi:hypothetical protein
MLLDPSEKNEYASVTVGLNTRYATKKKLVYTLSNPEPYENNAEARASLPGRNFPKHMRLLMEKIL